MHTLPCRATLVITPYAALDSCTKRRAVKTATLRFRGIAWRLRHARSTSFCCAAPTSSPAPSNGLVSGGRGLLIAPTLARGMRSDRQSSDMYVNVSRRWPPGRQAVQCRAAGAGYTE